MSAIYLKKNEDKRIREGHLWVFSNEIQKIDNNPENGDLVEIYDSKNNFIGTGFYNKNSLISCRILSYNRVDDLRHLFEDRISEAYNLRKTFYPNRNSFRLIFGESDFLPGFIIDKYNDTYVLQVSSFGIEKNIDLIVEILKQKFNAKNIFSKNEEHFRKIEGLPAEDKIYLGNREEEIIDDGKVKFKIDFEKSHKTGFYFDQCDNREFIERISSGKSVLDAFCNSGGFGLHAALAGAESITYVDSSANEIETAKNNFGLNDFKCRTEYVVSDVFDYFEKLSTEGKKFDIVNIDPPSFAKQRKNLPVAKKGYEKLNRLAMNLVKENGYLTTSSCSYHLNKDDFIDIIGLAANKAGKNIQLIHFNNASLDHPQLPVMPETVYLKFAVTKI